MAKRGRSSSPRVKKEREFKGLMPAPDAEKVARDIIKSRHAHLQNKNIEYAFKAGGWKRGGKPVLYKVAVVGGVSCYLYYRMVLDTSLNKESSPEKFFMVSICKDSWRQASEIQREALLDEALCHLFVTDQGEPTIIDPTITVVLANVNVYGLWHKDLIKVADRMKDKYQAEMTFEDELVEKSEEAASLGSILPAAGTSVEQTKAAINTLNKAATKAQSARAAALPN